MESLSKTVFDLVVSSLRFQKSRVYTNMIFECAQRQTHKSRSPSLHAKFFPLLESLSKTVLEATSQPFTRPLHSSKHSRRCFSTAGNSFKNRFGSYGAALHSSIASSESLSPGWYSHSECQRQAPSTTLHPPS